MTELVDDAALRRALDTLSTKVLIRLHRAMYEVCGRSEMSMIMALLWDRQGLYSSWSTESRNTAAGDVYAVTMFCSKATGPDDSAHRAMKLDLENIGGPTDYGCSCGARRSDPNIKAKLKLIGERDTGSPNVWPVIQIPVAGQVIPHFAVCGHAKSAFDRRHAPPEFDYLERCICGSFFKNSTYTLDEITCDYHLDCVGGPDGCTYDKDNTRFRGKLFPLY